MACLKELPNELLKTILDGVAVADFENFAQINRHVRSLAQQRLEKHRHLSRQYATLSIPAFELKKTYHLLKIFMSTDHGQYVRTFVLDDLNRRTQHLTPEEVDWLLHEVSNIKIFVPALEEIQAARLSPADRMHHLDILTTLILYYTPNVSCIRLPSQLWPEVSVWLEPILREAVLGDSQSFLEKLTTVSSSVIGSSVNGRSLNHLLNVLKIPSIRKLQLDCLGENCVPRGQTSAICPIQTVELVPSHASQGYTIDSQALYAFLAQTKYLTTLNIQSGVVQYLASGQERSTYADILSPVRSTLRNLTILTLKGQWRTSSLRSLGSFIDFIALEHFEAAFDGIYPQHLPPSLRSIKLHGKASCVHGKRVGKKAYSTWVFIEAVLDGHKSGANPILNRLEFTTKLAAGNKMSREMLEEPMRQCTRAGIQLKAPDVVDNMIIPATSGIPS
ncbi:MAG: hypothetical protein Q9221_006978 [Calogaya cf. arnoldii]